MIKLSDYIMQFVAKTGTRHVFMLPGGGCMHLVDSLGSNKKIKYVAVLHEQAAAIAADAYAQYTGAIGVVLVTTGPGGTNTITGVAASWIDSTPVLYLSGQAKRNDLMKGRGVRQMGVQEVDIISLVKPITKYAVTIMDPMTIRYHLEKAVYLANTGRKGPVWLEIPLDVQGAMIDEGKLRGAGVWQKKEGRRVGGLEGRQDRDRGAEVGRLRSEDRRLKKQINKTIDLIKKAERPVILAGNGIRAAGAINEFVKLAEKLKIPVLLTWRAADFMPDSHPLYFGRPGAVGQRAANFIQQNADLLITIGARLDLPQTAFDHANFAKKAKKLIVDIDKNEITKLNFENKIHVVEDAGKFIKALSGVNILFFKRNEKKNWLEFCRSMKEKYPVPDPLSVKTEKRYINTYSFIDTLSGLMKGNEILVPGSSGSCAEITMQTIKVKKGIRILNNPGLGSMGFGLPAGIGACIASGRNTLSIVGDGGLQHNIQELETMKRLKIPLKLFVFNNNGYGSIKMMQNRHFKGRSVACNPESGLTLPSLAKLAKAYGLKYRRINKMLNLRREIIEVLKSKGPVICELFVNPVQETIPRISSRLLPDGKIISMPMEELYPFLDKAEVSVNMLYGKKSDE